MKAFTCDDRERFYNEQEDESPHEIKNNCAEQSLLEQFQNRSVCENTGVLRAECFKPVFPNLF